MKEQKKEKMQELFYSDDEKEKIKEDINFDNIKSYIYTFVFYICGLVMGSAIYKQVAGDTINKIIVGTKTEFLQMFTYDFCLYFSIFLLTVFLGFCMIGFPIINLIPLSCGFVIGMKLAYYYVSSGSKGVIYSLLMIVPAASLLIAVITLTIKISTDMSKNIFELTTKKSDMTSSQFEVKSYLKKYLLFGLVIALAALFDAGMVSLFSTVVTI